MKLPLPGSLKGCRIAVVAPSSPPPPERLAMGLDWLTNRGFRPFCNWDLQKTDGYLSGSDEARSRGLQEALEEDSVPVVWAARGGYGVLPILPLLRPARRTPPPWVMGFSDISLLLATLTDRWGWLTWHAPNVTSIPLLDGPSTTALQDVLVGSLPDYPRLETVVPGQARGTLLAMNLSMLLASAGTPWFPALAGRILILEDTHEPPYRLDRLFSQLFLLPEFSKVAGLVLGDLGSGGIDPLFLSRLRRRIKGMRIPTSSLFPMGHGPSNWPVPNGVEARLDSRLGRLECL